MGCNRSADDYLLESNKLASQEKYKEAIILLNKAIQTNPKYQEAYLNKGLCYEKLKDLNSAVSTYQALLKIDPKNVLGIYNIGNCKYDMNLYQEAIENYTRALVLKGYSKDSTSFIVDWNQNGIAEDAKYDVIGSHIFYQRGLAYYQLNKFKSAYADFYSCLAQNYYVTDCHYMIALCFIESGNKEKGCMELDKAIALGDTLSLKKKREVCK
jgi:tetratricopeptide (TPR) repeat protein